jgi:hypothetical protein
MSWTVKISRRSGKDARARESTDPGPRAQSSPDATGASMPGDSPIRRAEDDTLGREPVARSFVQQVLTVDASEGLVVGVLGPWGSGKTSFINLARGEFKRADVPVLDFNPWMFSGAQQLVESFFIELAAQLRLRPDLASLGADLQASGEAFSGMGWLPVIGPWMERGRLLTRSVSELLQRRREGVSGRRAKLQKELATLRTPIIVVVDDIDRLSALEIRDVFKLVRLTASFPNIVYVVAFDRQRVEKALAEEGVPGRVYLEKILQVAVDLPAIPIQTLIRQTWDALDASLKTAPGALDMQTWPDVFMEIIRPLIRNMRDVRRDAAAVHGAVWALQGQVALADVLSLEAIRVFLPDVFAGLHSNVDVLTNASDVRDGNDAEESRKRIDGLINVAEMHGDVVRAMVRRLFPAAERYIGGSHYQRDWASRWLRERRVANEELLSFYLERVAGSGLRAFTDAEQAWARATDREALDRYLRSLDRERLQDVIASFEVYEAEFAGEHAVPCVTVLLNLMPDLPEREGGMFDFGARLAVTRVTYRLLRSLRNPDAVEAALRRILPELTSLSAKLELIGQVGYQEGRGSKFVSEAAATNFERAWRDEVRSTPVDDLVKEPNLLGVLLTTKRQGDISEPDLKVQDTPELTLALLRSARGDAKTQNFGSRAIRRLPRLAWGSLVELCGDEQTLQETYCGSNGSVVGGGG